MLGTNGTGTQISTTIDETSTATDIYGTLKSTATTGSSVGDNANTTAYYYNFKIDYMISTSKKDNLKIGVDNVKVYDDAGVVIVGKYKTGESYYDANGTKQTATADATTAVTAGTDVASLDKATRVAFRNATAYNTGDTVTYADSGKEYAIATACGKDHNLNALKELGYTGTSEYETYDQNQTVLDATKNFHSVTTPDKAKTTSDGSFTYGSVDVYVWFDGTNKACTNAIFSQK